MTKSAERELFDRRMDGLAKLYLSAFDNDIQDMPLVHDVGELFKRAILDNTKDINP